MSGVAISDDIVALVRGEFILAINLRLSTTLRGRARPDVDVVLATVPVADALRASILEHEILLRVRVPHDLALVEFAGGSSLGQMLLALSCLDRGPLAMLTIVRGSS